MIYVFRTSVKTSSQARKLKPHIDRILPEAKWNFDLDDCDKILRIDSEVNIISQIMDVLRTHRFDCEELQ
ncbi:MAG: hypothetical protein JO301_00115 [Chitinophagaceae bacterium]|nr:hypothetical protein [Chitinophagaceae bacterium]